MVVENIKKNIVCKHQTANHNICFGSRQISFQHQTHNRKFNVDIGGKHTNK